MLFGIAEWLSLGVILLIIWLFITKIRKQQNYFVEANVPGPRPKFLLGNLDTLWSSSHYFRQLESWTRQYGKVYGMFEGTVPIYVVSDVNFLEEAFIKQFTNFDRRKPLLFLLPGQEKRVSLFDANGTTWRRQRHVLNPTFSKAKLIEMLPLISSCADELIHVLKPYADKDIEVDLSPIYFRMSMDTILRCAFSFDTDVQRNLNNTYLKKLRAFCGADNQNLLFVKMATALPVLCNFILRIFMYLYVFLHKLHTLFPFIEFPELPLLWLHDRIGEHVLRVRKEKSDLGRVDLLHLMINAATDQQIVDEVSSHGKVTASEQYVSIKKLMGDEILGNVSIFLAGATEMVSTLLSYCTYVLATHVEVQNKLMEEIDANILADVKSPTYDMIEKLEYLDMFIKEVNRMYPISPIVLTRRCTQDTNIGQYPIKKGVIIQTDIYSVHYNEDLWGPVDPYKFYPERHADKRHPLAYITFGAGPRHCIGVRFAQMEVKMACVNMLRNFRILKSDHTDTYFRINDRATIRPEAIWIKLENRKHGD